MLFSRRPLCAPFTFVLEALGYATSAYLLEHLDTVHTQIRSSSALELPGANGPRVDERRYASALGIDTVTSKLSDHLVL
ncbi:hypothetical protein KXD40_009171 [Peronospora effusa]|nr:hypothetical protein KXD40_009171 [Peronospora effusa]